MDQDVKVWVISFRRDQLSGESMGWLLQQKWGLLLMASTPLPGTIPKQVFFGQPSCHIFQGTKHVPVPQTILHKIWVSYSPFII